MIGFIPRIYPNELLYSFVARYHEYSFNQSPKYTSMDLFGHTIQLAVPDLPLNLGTITTQLNMFMKIDVDDLINNHTFFTFYTNFISAAKRSFVRDAMISGDIKGAIHMTTGVMASGIKEKQFFFHCPKCIEEDLQENGETYWHLQHQLPGVFVCLKHNTSLFKSSISFRSKRRNLFVTASENDCIKPCLEIENKKTFEMLCCIARQCSNLATNAYNFDLNIIQKKYKTLLNKKGLLTQKGVVYQKKLCEQFKLFYGEELLRIFQSSISYDNPACWLKEITRKHKKAFHPIRHILLILFLGETLESIIYVEDKINNPFGNGPYLCLNKAASHYGKAIIPQVEIKTCSKTKQFIGTFKCECGFHFTRNSHDANDLYKISRVKQFGEIWINTAYDLIQNKKMSYRSAARQLGVDTNTIIKYTNLKKEDINEQGSKKHVECNNKKFEWLSLIKENPEKSVTELRSINPALYAFLYRNDKQWLNENSPKKERENNQGKIDWAIRDLVLKDEIERVVKNIVRYEPPVRVTISRIGAELGKRTLLEKHIHKLPESRNIINQYTEDIASFQKRRIKFCIENFMENGEEIKEWKLRRSAGLRMPINEDIITDLLKQLYVDQKLISN